MIKNNFCNTCGKLLFYAQKNIGYFACNERTMIAQLQRFFRFRFIVSISKRQGLPFLYLLLLRTLPIRLGQTAKMPSWIKTRKPCYNADFVNLVPLKN